MSKHTLKTEPATGVKSLHRDSYALNCPYRAPLAVPGQLAGQIALIATPCNSTCPLFDDDGKGRLRLYCCGQEIDYSSTDFVIGQ